MSQQKDHVLLRYQGTVAIITLNIPSKLNAMTQDLYYLLGQRLREVEKRDDIFITVVTGTGRFFSAGADVTVTRQIVGEESDNAADGRRGVMQGFVANNVDLARTIYTHSKILVFALNGPAVGLSAAIVAMGDFVYAAPHTYILTPFSSLGLVAEGAASVSFVERLGISKAKEALIMSKRISCEELVATGFVNKVFTPPSGKKDDSEGFLKLVLAEIEDRMGPHLSQSSLLGIKDLIRRPSRSTYEEATLAEAFAGAQRFILGIPQAEFAKIASGQKRHKL